MTDNKYDLDDLLVSTAEMKPADFEDAFNDIITNRIRAAVEEKKLQIAQQLYNYVPGQVAAERQPQEPENNGEEWENDIIIHNSKDSNNG